MTFQPITIKAPLKPGERQSLGDHLGTIHLHANGLRVSVIARDGAVDVRVDPDTGSHILIESVSAHTLQAAATYRADPLVKSMVVDAAPWDPDRKPPADAHPWDPSSCPECLKFNGGVPTRPEASAMAQLVTHDRDAQGRNIIRTWGSTL